MHENENNVMRPRPRTRPTRRGRGRERDLKIWPRDHVGLENLTSLYNCITRVSLSQIREVNLIDQCLVTPPPVGTGSGVLFSLDFFLSFFLSFFLCLFVSLFLCQQDYEKTAGPICMKFSGKVWSDHGTT